MLNLTYCIISDKCPTIFAMGIRKMPQKRLICKEKVVQISRTNKEELTSRIDAFITARRHLFDYLVLRADASWKGNPNCFLAFESPVFFGKRRDPI